MIDTAVDDAKGASAPFELHAGALRLAVRPDLGGAVAGLWHGDTPVLRSTDPARLAAARDAACFALLPYAGLLAERRFRWCGRDHTLRGGADAPNARDGIGWQRPWRIVSSSALELVLELRHAGDDDWPFAFSARQYLSLDAASFGARLQLVNDAAVEQPVGLGWWLSFVRRSRSRIHAELAHRWDTDATGFPARKVAQHGIDSDVVHLDYDHTFEGWRGPARIRDERLSLQLASSLPYLAVETAPERAVFSLAPVSQVANAIHMAEPAAHGVVALAPGATVDAWMRLDIGVV